MKSHRITLAEHLELIRTRADRHLFRKAAIANGIAKITRGRQRRLAYLTKNRTLGRLIERGRALVPVDQVRCRGLLSVGVSRRRQLHTHENWLEEARASVPTGNAAGGWMKGGTAR